MFRASDVLQEFLMLYMCFQEAVSEKRKKPGATAREQETVTPMNESAATHARG